MVAAAAAAAASAAEVRVASNTLRAASSVGNRNKSQFTNSLESMMMMTMTTQVHSAPAALPPKVATSGGISFGERKLSAMEATQVASLGSFTREFQQSPRCRPAKANK